MALRKKDNYYIRTLNKYLPEILKSIKLEYVLGSMIPIKLAKGDGKKNTGKPLKITKQEQEIYMTEISKALYSMADSRSNKINSLANDNNLNNGSSKDLAKDLERLFKNESSMSYNSDANTLNMARTFSTDILSQANEKNANKIGFNKKYLSVVNDNRTSKYCKALDKKYGSEDQAIPINDNFKTNVKIGKKVKKIDQARPPFHIACRTVVLYTD